MYRRDPVGQNPHKAQRRPARTNKAKTQGGSALRFSSLTFLSHGRPTTNDATCGPPAWFTAPLRPAPVASARRASFRCAFSRVNKQPHTRRSGATSTERWPRGRLPEIGQTQQTRVPKREIALRALNGHYLGFGRGRKILSILLAPRSNSGITPVGLLERYKGTSSPPFHRPVGCCGSQDTTGRQAIWNPAGFGPLCLCSSHCSLPSCKAV